MRLTLVLLLLGCTRWETYEVPSGPKPALPSSVRVSAPGYPSTVLVQPYVRRDTLYGRSRGDTLGFVLPALERVEWPRLDGLPTAAVVVGSLTAWITLGLVAGRGE